MLKLLKQDLQPERRRLDICGVFSLLLLVLHAPGGPLVGSLLMTLALGGLAWPRVRSHGVLWLAIAGISLSGTFYNWAVSDNHKYLMSYWFLALGCTLLLKEKSRADVAHLNARLLIGLTMLFATIWKLTSAQFLSGDFFEFTFLTDQRFRGVIASFTDLSYEQLTENTGRLALLKSGYLDNLNPESQQLYNAPMVARLATFATWWTVIIEGATAAIFLWRVPPKLTHVRHALLVTFAVTTYCIAPVAGFGCLLMVMGMAQCVSKNLNWFIAYAWLFVIVQVISMSSDTIWEYLAS